MSITSPTGAQGIYKVSLDQHIAAVDDEEVLFASVLIHSYALTEAAACDRLGLDSRSAGGIEKWAAELLLANGRSWADVFDGEAGAVEVAVIRNAWSSPLGWCTRLIPRLGVLVRL